MKQFLSLMALILKNAFTDKTLNCVKMQQNMVVHFDFDMNCGLSPTTFVGVEGSTWFDEGLHCT